MTNKIICPLCSTPLLSQSLKDCGELIPISWCPTFIEFYNGTRKFHFIDDKNNNITSMIVMPYCIVSDSKKSTISIFVPKDKDSPPPFNSGKFLFKILFHCPKIYPTSSDKLLLKINTLLLFS
jgi:hypothetical protein